MVKHSRDECIICNVARGSEESYLDALSGRLYDNILGEYSRGDLIICRRHYEIIPSRLLERKSGKLKKLREIQEEKLKKLLLSPENYFTKSDYRLKEKPAREEHGIGFTRIYSCT